DLRAQQDPRLLDREPRRSAGRGVHRPLRSRPISPLSRATGLRPDGVPGPGPRRPGGRPDRRERLVTLMPPPPGTATMKKPLSPLRLFAALALVLAAAQFRESGLPELAGHLELTVEQSDTGRAIPARVYLFKQEKPFRLSPVDAMLPL